MLKCVMYFSEYILKYIISKVKKKMLIAITMNISFTQMPGSIGHQSNWHGASGTQWGTTEGQRPGKHWGGGGAGCTLLLPPGCCSDPADGSWHWRSVCGSSLHFLSHHPSNEEEHFLRLTGAQVRCFLALPLEFRMQVFYSHAGAGLE